MEDREVFDENDFLSESDRIDPTLPEQAWESEQNWQGQSNVDWQEQGHNEECAGDAINKYTQAHIDSTIQGENHSGAVTACVNNETDDDEDLDFEDGALPAQVVEDDYHELLRQNDLEDDPGLQLNRYFSRKANEHRPGWIAPTAHEARVLLDLGAPIYRPVMPFRTSKSSRKYRPQITKEIVMRVLGLDSNEYLNLRGSARSIVQSHGLNLPDATGKQIAVFQTRLT